jgi:hypothetical protein
MLQIFYLDIAYVVVAIHICRKYMFVNVSSVSDVCCSKCFYVKCCMTRCGKWAQTEVVPLGAVVPACVRGAKRARRPPTCAAAARRQVR